MVKQIFEFRTTRNGTRVITKDMVDYQSVKAHFETNSQPFLLYRLPEIAETHQGSDPPPASKHSCGGNTRWPGAMPQSPSHYSPAENGDVLDIVVHKNIRLSHFILLISWAQITYQ
jgi:hypothetical protein